MAIPFNVTAGDLTEFLNNVRGRLATSVRSDAIHPVNLAVLDRALSLRLNQAYRIGENDFDLREVIKDLIIDVYWIYNSTGKIEAGSKVDREIFGGADV